MSSEKKKSSKDSKKVFQPIRAKPVGGKERTTVRIKAFEPKKKKKSNEK